MFDLCGNLNRRRLGNVDSCRAARPPARGSYFPTKHPLTNSWRHPPQLVPGHSARTLMSLRLSCFDTNWPITTLQGLCPCTASVPQALINYFTPFHFRTVAFVVDHLRTRLFDLPSLIHNQATGMLNRRQQVNPWPFLRAPRVTRQRYFEKRYVLWGLSRRAGPGMLHTYSFTSCCHG
jgi:hypothetical protein